MGSHDLNPGERVPGGRDAGRSSPGIALIVEDDEATRELLRAKLSRAGWGGIAVGTCSEAIEALDLAPDWLILDLVLPDGDGEQILNEVRIRGLATKVAVVSGAIEPARIDAVVRLAPDLFFRKPVDYEIFLLAIGGKVIDFGR
ncbi:response regulator [Singulisphaera rosea]